MEIANVDMARAWDGDEGERWVAYEQQHNRMTSPYAVHMFDAADIAPDDSVLDIGCGSGKSTREAARRATAGTALGVDLSSQQLDVARVRAHAEGLTNASFEQADAQVHPFEEGSRSVAISQFGVMFFADPVGAFTNIARCLRPNARLALVAWQEFARNESVREIRSSLLAGRDLPSPPTGGQSPFGLADPDTVRSILTDAGFTNINLDDVNESMEFGSDTEDAFGFLSATGIAKGMLDGLDDASRAAALDTLHATAAAHDTGQGVFLDSRAWLITATRR